MATLPLSSATIPEFRVDGQVQTDLARDLARVQVDDDIEGLRRLRASFIAVGPRAGSGNEQLNWLDGRVLDFGKAITVSMGPTTARLAVFSGKVSALELVFDQGRATELTCLAEDRLMDLRLTRRFRSYENVNDADLVREIAGQHGLTAQADLAGPTWPLVQQWNQSDLAFLRERARRLGAEVWVDDNTLHVATRDQRQGNPVTLVQGGNLMQVHLRADLAHQRSEVIVGGFDDSGQDAIDERADSTTLDAEAQGHTHGAQVLERAFGTRSSYRVRDVPLEGPHATAWARASLLTRARRFLCASGVAEGDATIQVGSRLRLERVSPLFEGDGYFATRVRHQFDPNGGYRTHFEAERAWIGSAA